MLNNAPIGLFDSGLGGLSVLQALRAALPSERFIYLGDTARTPYGTKSAGTIERYARECANFLLRQGVKAIVIACNTATAQAAKVLTAECPCPVIGAIQPAVQAAVAEHAERIIVIGTQATIGSGAYERELRAVAPRIPIVSIACPLFVPLVETGEWRGELVEHVIRHSFREIQFKPGDTLILGCTHFVFLHNALRQTLGNTLRIIDSATPIARVTAEWLNAQNLRRESTADSAMDRFYVTDAVGRFNALATLFLNESSVHSLSIEDLAVAA